MAESRDLPRLTAHQDDQVVDYRPLSVLAVVALVLGVISLAALLSLSLVILPLAGVLLSLLALARIRWLDTELLGRVPAMIGLALSLFSLSASSADAWFTRQRVVDQAERYAQRWFAALVRGDMELAMQLHDLPPASPTPHGGNLPGHRHDHHGEPATPAQQYRQRPLVARLYGRGNIVHLGEPETLSAYRDGNHWMIGLRYPVKIEGSRSASFDATLLLRRRIGETGVRWRIDSAELDK